MLRAARVLSPKLYKSGGLSQLPVPFEASKYFSTGASRVVEVTSDDNYQKQIKSANDTGNLAVVDFSAKWCGPCKVIAPVYAQLSTLYPQARFLKVDIDEPALERTVMENGIASVPTFVFVKDGQEKAKFSGADVAKLKETLDSYA
ncbi:g7637 [Coccomyxa elongata]